MGKSLREYRLPMSKREHASRVAAGTPDGDFCGFHDYRDEGTAARIQFEVFYDNDGCPAAGFYWWPCSPGCLPDGEANGPYPTAEGAYLAAIGD